MFREHRRSRFTGRRSAIAEPSMERFCADAHRPWSSWSLRHDSCNAE
jgi:hypothetical protein